MGSSNLRQPVVAGRFYPADPAELENEIAGFAGHDIDKAEVLACILPHAGYVYSGKVAVQAVERIKIKEKIVLLGPNHTGNGAPYSLMSQGSWQTPLGRVGIDTQLAQDLLSGSKYLESDTDAHLDEHSLEVELPIFQYFKKSFEIVPIVFMSDDLSALKQVGVDIAAIIKKRRLQNELLLAASTDMTHYESENDAAAKDKQALEAILELNPDKLFNTVKKNDISMCGYAPVVVLLSAANSLGASRATLISYQTSAIVTGDRSSVVGYASLTIR